MRQKIRATQYVVRNRDPLKVKSFRLRFRSKEKVLGIPEGDLGPGPNGGEDYAPFCIADIRAVEVHGHSCVDQRMCSVCDDEGCNVTIGHIKAQTVQVGRIMNDGMNLHEICDLQSDELLHVFNSLYERNGEPKSKHDEEVGCNDLLYIHEVYLKEPYRGYGIGLLAVDGFISGLPSFQQGTVLLSPNAISAYCEEGYDFKSASEKLEKHWGLLGFENWESSEEHGHIMGLWTGYCSPYIGDVVPHLMGTY